MLLGPPTFVVLALSTTVGFKAALTSGLVLALVMWMVIVTNDRMPSANALLPFTAALTPLTSWKVNRSLLGLRLVNGLLVGAVIALTGEYVTAYLGPSLTELWRDLGWGLLTGAAFGAVQQIRLPGCCPPPCRVACHCGSCGSWVTCTAPVPPHRPPRSPHHHNRDRRTPARTRRPI
ncbi:hypothetical protein ACIBG8_08770 [Nonomuraea sp. NPDC050556]|uniref:hypothetical protein n=1 Tax=Nonomuraea sp. NPDC050556 TaxID=3364369 RepID=UPI0037B0CAA3